MNPTAIVDNIQTHLKLADQSLRHFENGLKLCNAAVRSLNKMLTSSGSLGEKQRIMKCLAMVRSFKAQYQASQVIGFGVPKKTAHHRVKWEDTKSAFNNRIRTGVIINLKHIDPKAFLVDCMALFKRRIQNVLKKKEAVKVNAVLLGEFEIVKAAEILQDYKHITTGNEAIYRDTDVNKWFLEHVISPIMTKISEFSEKNSGWSLKAIINLQMNINEFTPQLGSSYIELPGPIKRKEACINVKNNDNACFAWAVVSALYPVNKNPQRTDKYPSYASILNLTGIQFPMTIRQIPRFEKQNNLSVNVYILKKERKDFICLPSYLTKKKHDKHVNLLLIQNCYDDKSEEHVRYHYVWIKNLSRLLSKQHSKNEHRKYFCNGCLRYFYSNDLLEKHYDVCEKSDHHRKDNFCDRCLNSFSNAEALKNHYGDCSRINNCRIRMPSSEKSMIKFKDFSNKERVPFVVYADIESILKPLNNKQKYQEHIPADIGYYLKCSYDNSLSFYRSYRGIDCIKWFTKELKQLSEDLETVFMCPYDIDPLTSEQQADFDDATTCHICELPFIPNDKKVRDHFHLASGKNNNGCDMSNYRGAAHNSCNINHQDCKIVPIVFHNLSNYDGHLIIEQIASSIEGKIDLLPVTKEKYISFTKHVGGSEIQFRFIDSFRFLSSSLDKLASYLTEFPNMSSAFPDITKEQFKLLTKKGIMPYDYINSFSAFDDECLPSIESFYNSLEDRPCPRRHHLRAKLVWEKFNIRNLGQYVDLYMKTDILLLVDVFEQFRTSCMMTYQLDPAHYYTLPGYTWSCMLYKTRQDLELLQDIDQLLFIERGIRGGLSQCSKRRVKANNKYMASYDPCKPDVSLIYFDINNQYGWSMSQSLPYGGFEWSDINIDVTTIPDDSPIGYMLEVDLEYPEQLHDYHKDLPFCPEHINPKTMKPPIKVEEITKLMATLHNKEKYVLHYRNLKQALQNGLVLSKVHRVMKFKQSPWLKSYIDLNTELRKAAKNEFEKNLFKLMNNAVFGKTMENIRNHSNIKLITKWDGRYGAEAMISKPEFKNCTIFNENLIAVELSKTEIFFNKPIYIGMAILDLAKTTIYDFHYQYMKKEFGEDCSLAYTDTDSLVYEILNRDIYEVIRRDCHERFDTSDYPPDNIYNIPQVNKKILGMMKDENNGVIMEELIGLRSKLYTLKLQTNQNACTILRKKLETEEYEPDEIHEIITNMDITKKAKGVKKNVVKRKITFQDYIDCLENDAQKIVVQSLIQAEKYHLYTITQNKVALDGHDDKRFLIQGSYATLPWGHYSIMDI